MVRRTFEEVKKEAKLNEERAAAECKGCQHFWDRGSWLAYRTPKFQHMTEAAEGGCIACCLLIQGIQHFGGKREPTENVALQYGDNGSGSKSLRVKLILDPPLSLTFYRDANAVIDPSTGVDKWPNGFRVPSSTASDDSFNWAVKQIEQCYSHQECSVGSKETILPSRVISISDSDPKDVRLHISSNGEKDSYVCLSHCWGSSPERVPRTLLSNFHEHQARIPWQSLSIKFQEAIEFTWRLGIRYIWIDSLCIIQDDNEDWQIQGAQMGIIYSNSYLTISAVQSSEADAALFSKPNSTPELYELHLPGQDETGISGLFCQPALSHIQYSEEKDGLQTMLLSPIWREPEPKFLHTPLLGRAWVLQERLLSSRVLHFGKEELFWECLEHCQCQCAEPLNEGGLAGQFLDTNNQLIRNSEAKKGDMNPKRKYSPKVLAALLSADSARVVVHTWMNLVQEFSSLRLSYATDVFPALSGLAKHFSQTLNAKYYAGVWEGFVPMCLLWKTPLRGRKGARSGPWRAPSWSWASVYSPVLYALSENYDEGIIEPCEVVDVQCCPLGADPTGQLSAGYLVLHGFAFTAEVSIKLSGGVHFDTITFDSMGNGGPELSADCDVTKPGPGYLADGALLTCLRVGRNLQWDHEFYLLLEEVAEEIHDDAENIKTYKRVGIVEVGDSHERYNDLYAKLKGRGTEMTVKII